MHVYINYACLHTCMHEASSEMYLIRALSCSSSRLRLSGMSSLSTTPVSHKQQHNQYFFMPVCLQFSLTPHHHHHHHSHLIFDKSHPLGEIVVMNTTSQLYSVINQFPTIITVIITVVTLAVVVVVVVVVVIIIIITTTLLLITAITTLPLINLIHLGRMLLARVMIITLRLYSVMPDSVSRLMSNMAGTQSAQHYYNTDYSYCGWSETESLTVTLVPDATKLLR